MSRRGAGSVSVKLAGDEYAELKALAEAQGVSVPSAVMALVRGGPDAGMAELEAICRRARAILAAAESAAPAPAWFPYSVTIRPDGVEMQGRGALDGPTRVEASGHRFSVIDSRGVRLVGVVTE